MRSNKWMLQATVLGLVFFLAVLLVKPVGVSTQFSVVSGVIHSIIDSSVITENEEAKHGYESTNQYYNKDGGKLAANIKNPWTYDLLFVLAIPVGAGIGYLLLERKKQQDSEKAFKQSFLRKYGRSFITGFLLLFGARMAGGCTSGHMMSGMMQGSVSGYLFAAAVFAVAIPVAIVSGNRNRRN